MKLKSLYLRNWMNVSEALIEFQSGINVLSGVVGSGKSSVPEAMGFALFGTTRGASWKDYIKRGTKGFELKFIVEVEQGEDMIFAFSGKSSSNSCEKVVTYKERTAINSECEQLVSSVLDLEMLEKVVFNMQSAPPISAMKPSDRRNIFKKIFNSDFSNIIERVNADKANVTSEIIKIDTQIKTLENASYDLFRIIEVEAGELDSLREELRSAQMAEIDKQKYLLYTQKLSDLTHKISEYNRTLATLKGYDDNKSSILEKIQDVESKIVNAKAVIDTRQLSLSDQVLQSESLKVIAESATKKEAEVALEVKAKNYDDQFRSISAEKVAMQSDISIVKKYIEAHKAGKCNSCGQTCEPTGLANLESQLSELNTLLAQIQARHDDLTAKSTEDTALVAKARSEAIDANKAYSESMLMVERATIGLERSKSEIPVLERDKASYVASIEALEVSKTHTNEDVKRLSVEVDTLEKWCTENKVEVSEESKRSSKEIQNEIDSILSQIARNAEQEKMNKTVLQQKEKDQQTISELSLKLNDLKLSIKNYDIVKDIFDKEFPGFINLQACSILENYMNSFFTTVKPDFTIKIDLDKNGVNIFYKCDDSSNWGNLKMTSGGEGKLVTLGFNVSTARAFGSNLLILDEPDSAKDSDSSARLFETINNISGFDQMVIISHQPAAMEYFVEQNANVYKVSDGEFERVIS